MKTSNRTKTMKKFCEINNLLKKYKCKNINVKYKM